MLTGEANNLKDDIHFDEKNYKKIETSMKERANKMRNQFPIYDHKDWTFLKAEKELKFEYENIYPNDTPPMIKNRIKQFIETDPNIKLVKPKPITEAGIASAEELKSLVYDRDGRDALLGHKCYVRNGGAYNGLTFDHLEPCSQVRYVDGSYSIGNIQILSRCINYVKGNYTEKELVRWLAKILETYEDRYGKLPENDN
jgi:hypothetical protein